MPKVDLKAMLTETAGSKRGPSPVEAEPAEPAAAKARAGRKDVVMIAGHFPPEVRKQLHQIALDRDTTAQRLLGEALNMLFARYGKPEIAPS
jgi:hypothetical protein